MNENVECVCFDKDIFFVVLKNSFEFRIAYRQAQGKFDQRRERVEFVQLVWVRFAIAHYVMIALNR